MNMKPPILFGAATSAYQVEGMNVFADWWMEEQKGNLPPSMEAVDHWNRWEEDFLLLKSAGLQAYRFSLSWPRIQSLPDRIDHQALDTYRKMVGNLRAFGVLPLVTLHHFVNPYWFARQGGWLHPESPQRFQKFVGIAVRALGDLVSHWITLNEPVVYAYQGFLKGQWPPFYKHTCSAFRVMDHLAQAHRLAYLTIKEHLPEAKVGIAKHMVAFRPYRDSFLDRWTAQRVHQTFNQQFIDKIRESFHPSQKDTPLLLDFLGINYYMIRTVRFWPWTPFELFSKEVPSDTHYPNTMGWPMEAGGLGEILHGIIKQGINIPLWITENGIATDEDQEDSLRQQFIRDHLEVIREARTEGIPIEGYLYWSLLDNYEWAEGFGPRFGLIAVDRTTQDRIPRRSLNRFRIIVQEVFQGTSRENP